MGVAVGRQNLFYTTFCVRHDGAFASMCLDRSSPTSHTPLFGALWRPHARRLQDMVAAPGARFVLRRPGSARGQAGCVDSRWLPVGQWTLLRGSTPVGTAGVETRKVVLRQVQVRTLTFSPCLRRFFLSAPPYTNHTNTKYCDQMQEAKAPRQQTTRDVTSHDALPAHRRARRAGQVMVQARDPTHSIGTVRADGGGG